MVYTRQALNEAIILIFGPLDNNTLYNEATPMANLPWLVYVSALQASQ